MDKAKKLMQQLEEIDVKIQQNEAILRKNNIGMDEPLVDDQDYPRDDIDIYAVTGARGKIHCLQNDRKTIMDEIEKTLVDIHTSNSEMEDADQAEEMHIRRTSNDAFVQVDKVMGESPAQLAGLLEGDQIIQFGPLYADIFSRLEQLKEVVQNSVNANKPIRITLLRNTRVHHVQLMPRCWEGKGLVGSSFVAIERKQNH